MASNPKQGAYNFLNLSHIAAYNFKQFDSKEISFMEVFDII